MINQLEKDMFYMDVCCCSNSNASLNSVDEHKFFRAVIHLPRVKEHITLQQNHKIVLEKSSRSTEILMEKLKPGTKYSVYVKAKTAKGYGTASDPVVMLKCFVCICEPC